ncbi:hypothetical protein [Poriferisphaera sp. WC338]|uniref:hypothetical protein n=1 Tax=Poriferisphaera sp. WC338 TaxID=3425129 RepID=UPI003D815D34
MKRMNSLKWLNTVVMLLLCATSVMAQDAVEVSKAPAQNTWVPMLCAIALIVVIGIGSFLWSKRGHHD